MADAKKTGAKTPKQAPGKKAAPKAPTGAPRPSEAIYAFAAWLTTREASLRVGAHHNAAAMAQVVDEYVTAHGYEQPREDFIKHVPARLPAL